MITTCRNQAVFKENKMLKKEILEVEFVSDEHDGEAGYFIYLKSGYSFDPMSNDTSTFIPEKNYKDFIKTASVYKIK
jgi:hypothetical protein